MSQPQSSSFVTAALAGEANKPATCYTICDMGPPKEGIRLSLDNIHVGPALFLENRYVKRHRNHGCIYRPMDGEVGLVRRAIIEWVDLPNKLPIPLLTQPLSTPEKVLVHVTLASPMSLGKLREEFYEGILTTGTVVSQVRNQMLTEMKEGDELVLFYRDGTVRKFSVNQAELLEHPFSIEDMAHERMAYLRHAHQESIRTLTTEYLEHPEQVRWFMHRDWIQHQLCLMLQTGGKRSPAIFDVIYGQLTEMGKDGHLRTEGVRARALKLVRSLRPSQVADLEMAFLPSKFYDAKQYAPLPGSLPRKGVPHDRLNYLSERAERRRLEGPQKGPSLSKPNPHSSKKKGSK